MTNKPLRLDFLHEDPDGIRWPVEFRGQHDGTQHTLRELASARFGDWTGLELDLTLQALIFITNRIHTEKADRAGWPARTSAY